MTKKSIHNAISGGRLFRAPTPGDQYAVAEGQLSIPFDDVLATLVSQPTGLATAQTVLNYMIGFYLTGDDRQAHILRHIRGMIHTELQKVKQNNGYAPRSMRDIVKASLPRKVEPNPRD